MRRLAYRYLRDEQLAQDVVQEAILAFWKNYGRVSFMSDDKLSGYLYGMVKNKIYKAYNKMKREMPIEEIGDLPQKENVEDVVIGRLGAETITKHIAEMPTRYGMYITMAYLDEMEPRHIAEALGVKPSSLRMIAYRAKKLLKELCSEEEWPE